MGREIKENNKTKNMSFTNADVIMMAVITCVKAFVFMAYVLIFINRIILIFTPSSRKKVSLK